MRKLMATLGVITITFMLGLFLGSRVGSPRAVVDGVSSFTPKLSVDPVVESTLRAEGFTDEMHEEILAFDARDLLTESLLVEEIELLKEDIQDLEGYIYELTHGAGGDGQTLAQATLPALSKEGYLSDALIDDLELTSYQVTQVNTVLSGAKDEVDLLSKDREKITRPKRDLYLVQQKEFRKDGKDIRRSMYENLAQEIGESKAQLLFRRANEDFKKTYHNFGQTGHKTTIKLNPKGPKNKGGVFIKDEHIEYLPGNRTVQKVDSGYYKQFPKRYEHLLDMEF